MMFDYSGFAERIAAQHASSDAQRMVARKAELQRRFDAEIARIDQIRRHRELAEFGCTDVIDGECDRVDDQP